LNLDMDFMGDWDPTAKSPEPPKAKAKPSRPFGEALAPPLPPMARPARGAPTAVAAGAAPKAEPPKPIRADLPASPKPVPAPSAPTHPIPTPAAVVAKPPVIAAAKPAPAAAAKAEPAPAALAPAAKLGAAPIARPIAKPAPAPAALTDDRVRELHARLVEAKRQTQDTGAVSVEGLAKSLKATEAKLREQHKNRKIDFDVVIKDGKAVLKPIVR
jgi:hypothetical protein